MAVHPEEQKLARKARAAGDAARKKREAAAEKEMKDRAAFHEKRRAQARAQCQRFVDDSDAAVDVLHADVLGKVPAGVSLTGSELALLRMGQRSVTDWIGLTGGRSR